MEAPYMVIVGMLHAGNRPRPTGNGPYMACLKRSRMPKGRIPKRMIITLKR